MLCISQMMFGTYQSLYMFRHEDQTGITSVAAKEVDRPCRAIAPQHRHPSAHNISYAAWVWGMGTSTFCGYNSRFSNFSMVETKNQAPFNLLQVLSFNMTFWYLLQIDNQTAGWWPIPTWYPQYCWLHHHQQPHSPWSRRSARYPFSTHVVVHKRFTSGGSMSLAIAAAVVLIMVNTEVPLGPQICSVSAWIYTLINTIEWTIDPYPKFSDWEHDLHCYLMVMQWHTFPLLDKLRPRYPHILAGQIRFLLG